MMLAAAGGHVRVMGTLQSFGAQLDTQTLSGNTALMQAVREEQPAALKYILDRSTVDDVNVMADDGSTALSVATATCTDGTQTVQKGVARQLAPCRSSARRPNMATFM